ncbi:MAG: anthranilate phosphoribosyltransferase [Thermoguttaceae bacterium]|nr:anthranilate phosphoribosyltransferase [Thermoguttaceae bacterium]MDW8079576.1 anthranilate phosphoribosyltransferase [Thermoguttaceae bacterium]
MRHAVSEAIHLAESGRDIPEEIMREAIGAILRENIAEETVARLLTALARKGEAVCEIVGAAQALREAMVRLETNRSDIVDVVGTGGDRAGTFNVSTATAIVVAAAGVPVAKHGNRSVTSRSGSADVLRELGVNIEPPLPVVYACLECLGICFCFAPRFHPAMKQVAPVRQKLGFPTIFNLLGPLVNPAGVAFQLLGVGRPEHRPKLAEVIRRLGTTRTWVVHNSEGLDELGLEGVNLVSETTPAGTSEFTLSPGDWGLPTVSRREITVQDAAESARVIRDVLSGKLVPARHVVLANSAAVLRLVGQVSELPEGIKKAEQAIDSGRAKRLLDLWIRCSHASTGEEARRICQLEGFFN